MQGYKIFSLGLFLLATSGTYGAPVGECPVGEEIVTFLTDDSECSIFYMCNFGTPVQFSCPLGTYFDLNLGVCNWADAVDCNVGSTTEEPDEDGSDEDVEGSGEGSGYLTDELDDDEDDITVLERLWTGECPTNDNTPKFLRHAFDCTKYFECDRGRPVEMECPPGLHFSVERKVCAYPQVADCRIDSQLFF